MPNIKFGKKIKELRKQKRWTQTQLGDYLGIGLRQVQRYEKDETQPDLEQLGALSKLFEYDLISHINSNEFHEGDAIYLKDPLYKKVSNEWAVIKLLVHEIALINSKTGEMSFQECLDELNNKVRLILRGAQDA